MKEKNKRLALVLVLLAAINVTFFLVGTKSSGVSFEEGLFMVEDTAAVSRIQMESGDAKVQMERVAGEWRLNEKYRADEGMMRMLMAVMYRVRVNKPVPNTPKSPVTVRVSGEKPMQFLVWGNAMRTRTYFALAGQEQAYEVAIPGYNEYLAEIFELDADQWRDRLVLDASWRTIQRLDLDYTTSDDRDVTIHFDESFFRVDGLLQIDSGRVVDYLNQFQYFEVNEWVSRGRYPRYDSLVRSQPLATLTIETIHHDDPLVFEIFPRLGMDAYHILTDTDQNMLVLDRKRVEHILGERSDFAYKE